MNIDTRLESIELGENYTKQILDPVGNVNSKTNIDTKLELHQTDT